MVVKIKKQKAQKCVIKRKLKFENYKNCLEATQLEKKINHLEKNNIDIHRIRENQKEFIRNNNSILNTQQRFKRERHNVFTEEINKIALKSNDNKRMHPNDSIEIYAYGTSRYLVSEKEEIKRSNIIK